MSKWACIKRLRRWKIFGACTTMSVLPATYPQALTTAFSRFVCNCFAHLQVWPWPCLTLYDATSVTKLNQEGIFPDWEDEKNGSGGRWIINSDRWIPGRDADLSWIDVALHRQQRVDVLDTHWLEILIFMIGEQAEVVQLQLKMSLLSNWGLTNDLLYRCTHLRSTELLWICAQRGTNWGWVEWLFKMGQILDWLIENGSQDSSNTGLNLFINFSFINNDYLKVWLADTSADSVLRVGRQLFWHHQLINYCDSLKRAFLLGLCWPPPVGQLKGLFLTLPQTNNSDLMAFLIIS